MYHYCTTCKFNEKQKFINKCKYHIVYTVQVYKLSEYRKYTCIYSDILFSMRNTATYIYLKLAVRLYQDMKDCLIKIRTPH